jgi:hypothetical protein
MEPEGPLPSLQEPAAGPYPATDDSIPYPSSHFFLLHFNIVPHEGKVVPCA